MSAQPTSHAGTAPRPSTASHRYTPQQLIDSGFLPVPMDPRNPKHVLLGDTPDHVYTAADFAPRQPMQLRTGRQPNGRYLECLDLDKHRANQDPDARLTEIRRAVGDHCYSKLVIVKSTNGEGRDVLFHTLQPVQSTTIYNPMSTDTAGELIGIGSSQRAPVPYSDRCIQGSLYTIPTLNKEDLDRLLNALYMPSRPTDATILGATERKADIRKGSQWCSGWEYQAIPDLHSLLASNPIGKDLLSRLDTPRADIDRSKEHANLVQHLMLRATKEGPSGFLPRCRWVARLASTANAFGKGSDRDYKQDPDTFALIYRISQGAQKLNGGRFIQPAWCKNPDEQPAIEMIADAEPAPRGPGRPAGERATRMTKLRRELRKLAIDDQVTTKVAYLAERCGVCRRSLQSYLRELADAGEIETGQINGNSGLYVLLKVRFGGASNSQTASPKRAKTAKVRCASANAIHGIATPQSTDQASTHKVEGTPEPCAPPSAVADAGVVFAANSVADGSALAQADAVGVQHSGVPSNSSAADVRPVVRTPRDKERHEINYELGADFMRRTEAYQPDARQFASDVYLSHQRKAAQRPRTQEDDDLLAVLEWRPLVESVPFVLLYDDHEMIQLNGTSNEPPKMPYQQPYPVVPSFDECDVTPDTPLTPAVAYARKLVGNRRDAWLRNANNLDWWRCSFDDDQLFTWMEFRAAALAEIGRVANAA